MQSSRQVPERMDYVRRWAGGVINARQQIRDHIAEIKINYSGNQLFHQLCQQH